MRLPADEMGSTGDGEHSLGISSFALDRFIPDSLQRAGADAVGRARLAVGLMAGLGVTGALCLAAGIGFGAYRFHAILGGLLALAGFVLPGLLLRRTRSLALTGNALVLVLFAVCTGASVSFGGLAFPAVFLLASLPLLATVLAGVLSGVLWMVCSLVEIGGLYVLHRTAIVFPLGSDPGVHLGAQAVGAAALAIVTTGLAVAYEARRSQALTAMRQAKQQLDEVHRGAAETGGHKAEFLANMSHEIRNPMNAIIGMTDLVLDSELQPEQREYLTTARKSAETLLGLLDDVLDFAKIEVGRLRIEATPFALKECVDEALRLMAPAAAEKGLSLAADVSKDIPDTVIGDAHRVRQVLLNLAGNAVKFTEAGRVTVHVGLDSRSADGVVLHVSVADTGIGIPEEKQAAIFEAFVQAGGSAGQGRGGSGLGLAIASELVQMMGGRLWLESEPGQGSTFHYTVNLGVPRQTNDRAQGAHAGSERAASSLRTDEAAAPEAPRAAAGGRYWRRSGS